jgi:hypothetical protein
MIKKFLALCVVFGLALTGRHTCSGKLSLDGVNLNTCNDIALSPKPSSCVIFVDGQPGLCAHGEGKTLNFDFEN